MMLAKRTVSLLPALLLLAAAVGGCAPSQGSPGEPELPLAPLAEMPPEIQEAPVVVQQAYRFAAANPQVLSQIPCYCGCGEMGHGSNYACYIAGADPEGGLRFDAHALGCSICVDITQDVMRMQSQGEDLDAIRAAVDATYSRYGPSNMP
jgi:Protein of unknown function with PCYCGC motif